MKDTEHKRIFSQKYKWAGYLIMVVLMMATIFGLSELVLRNLMIYDNGLEYRIPHPVLGWVLEPDGSYTNYMVEDTVKVEYNSQGFRDVDHVLDKPRGVFRILVLGDSFMEAYSVELEDAFSRQVEALVSEAGVDVEVINMGVGGYGTLQEYLLYKEAGGAFQPDLVLLGFYPANDVRNNSLELEEMVNRGSMKSDSRPFLDPAQPDEWSITSVDFEGARKRYEAEKARRSGVIARAVEGLLTIQLVKRAVNKIAAMTSGQSTGNDGLPEEKRSILGQYGVNYCQEPPEYTRAWNTSKRILERLDREIAYDGGKMIVFSVPALHDTGYKYMERIKQQVPEPDTLCFEEAPAYKRLEGVLGELDIVYIDLLPEFRRAALSRKLFRKIDRHWNAEGHALAARTVVSALFERNIFPSLLQ